MLVLCLYVVYMACIFAKINLLAPCEVNNLSLVKP